MKQYLWVGIALLFVSAQASENPFDLKDNLDKLEKDQTVLLDDLRKLAEMKELAEEAVVDESPIEERLEEKIGVPLEKENQVKKASKNEIVDVQKELDKKQNLLDVEKEEAQAVMEQQNTERDEVEAYEKQRAEKLARQRAEAAALEEERKAQQEARARRLARKEAQRQLELADAKAEQLAKEKAQNETKTKVEKIIQAEEDTRTSVDDINVTREKLEAKIAADKAYEEAVREMSQED